MRIEIVSMSVTRRVCVCESVCYKIFFALIHLFSSFASTRLRNQSLIMMDDVWDDDEAITVGTAPVTSAQANNDDFGESFGSNDEFGEATMRKISDKLYKDGFRVGKAAEDEVVTQLGFDSGFEYGMRLGKACGNLYGSVRMYMTHVQATDEKRMRAFHRLENILLHELAESDHEPNHYTKELERLLNVLSVDPISLQKLKHDFSLFQNSISNLS